MSRILAILALLLLFIASCTQEEAPLAGTDTGNPIISALHYTVVRDSSGTPLANAEVTLYSQNANKVTVAYHTFTDSQGKALISDSLVGSFIVEALWQDSLGLMTHIELDTTDTSVELRAGELVPYQAPTSGPVAILTETGRSLGLGQSALLPPGLWHIRFSDSTLPALSVRVEDARSTPQDLSGLASVAQLMKKMDIEPGNYQSLTSMPTTYLPNQRIENACKMAGTPLSCGSDQCRMLHWNSDWINKETQVSVNATAFTSNGDVSCLLFTSDLNGILDIYTLNEVKKGP